MTTRPSRAAPCSASRSGTAPPGTARSTTCAAAIASGIATVSAALGEREANATSWPARRHAAPIVVPMLPLPSTAMLVMGEPYAARPRARGGCAVAAPLRDLQRRGRPVGRLEAELVERRLHRLHVARARERGAADRVDVGGLLREDLLLQDGRGRGGDLHGVGVVALQLQRLD